MELFIDTTANDYLRLRLIAKGGFLAEKKVRVNRNQSEKLWPALAELFKANKIKKQDIKKIIVANGRGSFTALRIGIAAANALAFAWGIKVADENGDFKRSHGLQLVEPRYTKEANIG